jgi:hypothetical protein
MPWFKVDDKLHDHRKSRKAGKSAMGVWVLAGSWSMDNDTDGFIPNDVIGRWGTKADAASLVAVGLWVTARHKGEEGWRFHDWSRFQPSAAVTAARKAAEAEAGIRGNHKRWHEARGITDPDCEYCYRVPDQVPDDLPEGGPESGANRVLGESGATPPVPVPDPIPHKEAGASSREDVDRLCNHLADHIEAHGVPRPTISNGWRTAARLLLDKDGYTETQVRWLIDKAHADEFWRSNILSMPKLREKATQLRLKFGRPQGVPSTSGSDPNDWMRRSL